MISDAICGNPQGHVSRNDGSPEIPPPPVLTPRLLPPNGDATVSNQYFRESRDVMDTVIMEAVRVSCAMEYEKKRLQTELYTSPDGLIQPHCTRSHFIDAR